MKWVKWAGGQEVWGETNRGWVGWTVQLRYLAEGRAAVPGQLLPALQHCGQPYSVQLKNVITISAQILCGHQCRYEIFDRESDENNLDLKFFICQSAATKNYRSKISIYIDHWDYLI